LTAINAAAIQRSRALMKGFDAIAEVGFFAADEGAFGVAVPVGFVATRAGFTCRLLVI
jgi:hypothetical protein